MKIRHKNSFLYVFFHNKKYSFAAIAFLISAIVAPVLILRTHAADEADDDRLIEIVADTDSDTDTDTDTDDDDDTSSSYAMAYTVVGPDYFTVIDLGLQSGQTARIADTTVADFIPEGPISGSNPVEYATLQSTRAAVPSHGPINMWSCYYNYTCIQGKKIGTTEILIEEDGEETIHIPLTSVVLTPEAIQVMNVGDSTTGTGSIEGADSSLLTLYEAGSFGDASIQKTGDKSYSASFEELSSSFRTEGYLLWKIADQFVGGGTFFLSLNVNSFDYVSHSEENENKLTDAMIRVFKALASSNFHPDFETGFDLAIDDGTTVHFSPQETSNPEPDEINVKLNYDDTEPSGQERDLLLSAFPDGIKEAKTTSIVSDIDFCFEIIETYRSVEDRSTRSYCTEGGEFLKLGFELDFTIAVDDTEELKEDYARKWYVVRSVNGQPERIEAEYDEATKSISFKSNVLGLYAYGYIDENIVEVPLVPNSGVK